MGKETIKQKALYILNNLGGVADSDYDTNYSGKFSIWCSYEKEGLLIRSDDLEYARTSKEIKKSMTDVYIKYDKELVFDSKTGKYTPGFWEELLNALCEKVPKILNDEKEHYETLKRGQQFFEKTLLDIRNDHRIGNDIVVKNEKYERMDWHEENSYTRTILNKGQVVLKACQTGDYGKMLVTQYVPGEWEDQVVDYVHNLEEKRKESQKVLARRRLENIRNL